MKRNLIVLLTLLCLGLPQLALAGEAPKIIGFAKVNKFVYRGGRPKNDEQMQQLRSAGIRTVINLQGYGITLIPGEKESSIEKSEASALRAGLRYLKLPFEAAAKLDEIDQATVIEVARAMNDPQLQPVYVHCNVGADRTGVAVAAYRILYQGCNFEQAKKEIRKEGKFWTRLFTAPQLRFLRTLERDQRKISGTLRQKCPLPAID